MTDFENLMERIMKSEKTNNRAKGMRVKSSIKAGLLAGICSNHNQTVVRKAKGLRVKSSVKAGMGQPVKDWIDN